MFKIKKQDTVLVSKGKDKGKKGKVIEIFTEKNKALVEGINLVKKHRRQSGQNQQGGIFQIEAPISLSNLMFFCKNCNRAARVGFTKSKDGTKNRICRKCQGAI
jgi:large subunit ribosomal protein L24